MTDVQDQTEISAAAVSTTPSLVHRLLQLIRTNRPFVILLGVGALVRLIVMFAYQPAFWYGGDSGSYIDMTTHRLRPVATAALGYVVFLKPLRYTGTLFTVVAVQHLLGLLIAVAVYALLRRRGVRRWLACLAAVPLLFDSLALTLEHAIMVETFHVSLLVAAVVLLLWNRTPNALVCVLAGLSLAMAWFVRPLILPLVVLVFGYLVVRRVGWRQCGAFALAFVIPYAGVQAWVGDRTTPYGTSNIAYYARVAGFAQCDRLTLTDAERALCPPAAISGHRPDWYIWVPASPGFPYRQNASGDPILRQFAIDVVRQQPLDYLKAAGLETAAHFVDGVPLSYELRCLDDLYSMPQTSRLDGPGPECRAQLASGDFRWPGRDRNESPPANALTTTLAAYSSIVRTPHLATLGVYLLVIAAAFVQRRRRRRDRSGPEPVSLDAANRAEPSEAGPSEAGPLARDALTLALLCLTIIVLPAALFMYAERYAFPALPLLCLAGGLAGQSLLINRANRRRPTATAPPAEPAPAD
jgi:hypothetical protein